MSIEGIKRTIINTCAFEAVDEIIADLGDRKWLRQVWEEIDEETKHQIRRTWSRAVARAIRKAAGEE